MREADPRSAGHAWVRKWTLVVWPLSLRATDDSAAAAQTTVLSEVDALWPEFLSLRLLPIQGKGQEHLQELVTGLIKLQYRTGD